MQNITDRINAAIRRDKNGPTAQLLGDVIAEIERLQADAGRLDWIDSQWRNGVHVEACAKGDGTTWHALRRECTVYDAGEHSAENTRAAIDAAMKGE